MTFGFTLTSADAELPPYVYANYQQNAEEKLRIKALTVGTTVTEWGLQVAVQAEVLQVKRTATDLFPGAFITIHYGQKNNPEGEVAPGGVPLLSAGEEYPAFLDYQENEDAYSPAAGSWSFDPERMGRKLAPIHFAPNSFEMSLEERRKQQNNAHVIMANRNWIVQIEGYTDEQGTEEYNLNLGERMALRVKEYLVILGVPEQRLRTISYGEEVPLRHEHNEEAWAENRRVEFRLLRLNSEGKSQ